MTAKRIAFALTLFLPLFGIQALSQNAEDYPATITLNVDASDAAAKIIHGRLYIPAKPGPLTLVFPKWIPGEHGPTGPIENSTGLRITAAGQPIRWQRDNVDVFTFHMDVPAGADAVDVALDYISPVEAESGFSAGTNSTAQMTLLSWNSILVYPAGFPADRIPFKASLKLPNGWKYGTPLTTMSQGSDGTIDFKPVSLYSLIDSPVIAGRFFRTVKLTPPGFNPPVQMDIAADSDEALQISPQLIDKYKNLVTEAVALFGSTHYREYHFLLSLSNHVAHFGLEHHEANDSRTYERALVDPDVFKLAASLLPHEYVHSWNGKFRRPAGLVIPDFNESMKGDLLWVYEGLTEYLGDVLAARSGLQTIPQYRDYLAITSARLNTQSGRTWRPLIDTTIDAQILYNAASEWQNWRRTTDFYDEGELIWLEADVLIRQTTNGSKSLDDFCKIFFAGATPKPIEAPAPKPYMLDEVVSTLKQVAPYDWQKFFEDRLWSTASKAPLGGIENGGWKLAYQENPSEILRLRSDAKRVNDFNFSLGLQLKPDGLISDVNVLQPAGKAGIMPGMRLVAVNGRAYRPEVLGDMLRSGKTSKEPLELLVENAEYYKTYRVDYHGGPQYPYLESNGKKDWLTEIISPKAK